MSKPSTPTWKVANKKIWSHDCRFVHDGDGGYLCECYGTDEAAQIVREHNSHSVLVAALKSSGEFIDISSAYNTNQIQKTIRAALAAAEEAA